MSTMSYSDYALNANSVTPPSSRLVIHHPVGGKETDLTRYLTLSLFYQGVPVTQYSPPVFDAFVNHTRVSSVLRAFTVCQSSNMMGGFTVLGGANFCS